MFTSFRRLTTTASPFALFRQANRIAQSQPEVAAELRMLAIYGKKKQGGRPQGGSKTQSKPLITPAPYKPAFAAEVRIPRVFVSLFSGKPALA
ncbi:hypothetical protein [uncultured Oxalicibacterium sp.]|uniref:hypothetical protein n=1 Tax=uncultured Oxalicibacterium sp. TaxID=1168540 RepID=UPI0025DA5B7F|nr:hypothetical protein [uncultured Oxalicibacterium sp.]